MPTCFRCDAFSFCSQWDKLSSSLHAELPDSLKLPGIPPTRVDCQKGACTIDCRDRQHTHGGARTCTVSVQLQIDRKLEIYLCLLLKHEKLLVHIEGCCNWRMRRLLLSCGGADGCLG